MRYEHLFLRLNVEGWGQRDTSLQNTSIIKIVAIGWWGLSSKGCPTKNPYYLVGPKFVLCYYFLFKKLYFSSLDIISDHF